MRVRIELRDNDGKLLYFVTQDRRPPPYEESVPQLIQGATDWMISCLANDGVAYIREALRKAEALKEEEIP